MDTLFEKSPKASQKSFRPTASNSPCGGCASCDCSPQKSTEFRNTKNNTKNQQSW